MFSEQIIEWQRNRIEKLLKNGRKHAEYLMQEINAGSEFIQ